MENKYGVDYYPTIHYGMDKKELKIQYDIASSELANIDPQDSKEAEEEARFLNERLRSIEEILGWR